MTCVTKTEHRYDAVVVGAGRAALQVRISGEPELRVLDLPEVAGETLFA
jgi:succinate dehydrogenase/fumarate reductase flavoprotein subunit